MIYKSIQFILRSSLTLLFWLTGPLVIFPLCILNQPTLKAAWQDYRDSMREFVEGIWE